MVGLITTAAIAHFVSKSFEESSANLAKKFVEGVTGKLAQQYELITANFKPHLKTTYDRCTKLKTILKKDEPVDLISHYVDLNFTCGDSEFTNDQAITEIRNRKKIIIFGTAGTGKTIFMKYLWLSFFYEHEGRIPIFVELRRLNDFTSENLLSYVRTSLAHAHSDISEHVFAEMIRKEKFVFILDGFDEINIDKRAKIEKQVLELANSNPNCTIVVSSRPDDRLVAWQAFSILKVEPLTKDQVVELIQKIYYEPETKKKFIARIKADLYEEHESFLSSPLLATMMLMMFDQFADVPKKLYLFYEQAFETLFLRHDAVKEAFQRQLYTNYSMDVFKRYFSMFCLVSYFDEKIDFSLDEICEYFEKGFALEGIKADWKLFLRDLQESICVMQPDGLRFVFTHRSFQEFFAAYALSLLPKTRVAKILDRISLRDGDSVIEMLFDMNQELVESEFALPVLDKLIRAFSEMREENFTADYMRFMGIEIGISGNGKRGISTWVSKANDHYHRMFFLDRLYPDELKKLSFPLSKYEKENRKAAEAYFSELQIQKIGKSSKNRTIILYVDVKDGDRVVVARNGRDAKSVVEAAGPVSIDGLVDKDWLQRTGFAQFFADSAHIIRKLSATVQKRRLMKSKRLDEIFGLAQ